MMRIAPWVITAVAVVGTVACLLEIQRMQGALDQIERQRTAFVR